MYGTALLAADIPGLHLMGRLGLRMTYLDFDDAGSLAAELRSFFVALPSHAEDVKHNLAYCSTVGMADIVDAYLDEIEGLGRERVGHHLTAEVAPPVVASRLTINN